MSQPDAVIVGAGPNGLTAAVTLAAAGLAVRVYEAAPNVGGGARTEELTVPGFRHDSCSTAHPLGAGSPVFGQLPLRRFGLEWVHPPLPLAHPTSDGTAVLAPDLAQTARGFGPDAGAYRRLLEPFSERWDDLATDVLRAPLTGFPEHPALLARFGLRAALPVAVLARALRTERARTLLTGLAAHVMAPPYGPGTGGVAMLFALAAHAGGWPFARGGSQAVTDALAGYLTELGGQVHTGCRIRSFSELPRVRAYLFDTSPTELSAIAGHRLGPRYRAALGRVRYGPAAFKIDYALDGPVPWSDDACRHAGTVHIGASRKEIAAALTAAGSNAPSQRPFLITAQPSLFDPTRAPEGRHVFWAYAHVPNGWRGDLTDAVEAQLERAAPGFRDLVLARAVRGPAELAATNPNYVGGDIACGSFSGTQTLLRPTARPVPYSTPDPAVYLCSAATPPGPGVHGMCGYHAARIALARRFGVDENPTGSA